VNKLKNDFSDKLKEIVESKNFNILVTLVILFSALLVGLGVEPSISESWKSSISLIEIFILVFFVVELLIRVGAEAKNPVTFFKDPWNVFDLIIVLLCFIPLKSNFFFILRLARILRTMRLFRAFPKLRAIIQGMLNSFSSVLYVAMLLFVLVYVFAIIGVSVFAQVDPINFGSIPLTFFTLFQVLTLESWNVIMIPVVQAFPLGGPLYFISFIVLGTMLIMNLFLGVIVNNMNTALKALDETQERSNEEKILAKVTSLEKQLTILTKKLKK